MQATYFVILAIIKLDANGFTYNCNNSTVLHKVYDDLAQRGVVRGLLFSPFDERPLFFLAPTLLIMLFLYECATVSCKITIDLTEPISRLYSTS